MRKALLLILLAVMLMVTISIAVAIGIGIHSAGALNGATLTIDGETVDSAAIGALVGVAAAFGVAIACLVAIAVVASIAIVIPIVLVLIAGSVLLAIFVGIAPLAFPVLLVVGAYVLLSRRAKRRATNEPASLPASPSAS